jgi:PLP dependent protein
VSIAERLTLVRERIEAAAGRAGRDPSEITLVAVTKGYDDPVVADALEVGLNDLGENRVDALTDRSRHFPEARWHMVGRLQTNKVAKLPDGLAAIHSVDRPSLVDRLARRYVTEAPPLLFVEVNVAREPQKGGVSPEDLGMLLSHLDGAGLAVSGLMTVAPAVDDPEKVRVVFRSLAALAQKHGIRGLSMGMTDDFTVAVEEGATVVRVGRAIFSGGDGHRIRALGV